MGKLSAALAKDGITIQKKETKKGSKTEIIEVDPKVASAVDSYLSLKRKMEEMEAEIATKVAILRNFGLDNALDAKTPDTVVLQGKTGRAQITIKEQFTINSEERYNMMKETFGEKVITDLVKSEDEISIDYTKMTDKEQSDLIAFIKKSFTPERTAALVKEQTKYKTKNLCKYMFEKAKDMDQLTEWRSVTAHFSPTVTEYKAKKDE
jgi:hypothetical protein